MVKEYSLVRTTVGKHYSDCEIKDVYIPAGTEAYVVDKFDDGWCIIEIIEDGKGYPIVADYKEDELEMVEE